MQSTLMVKLLNEIFGLDLDIASVRKNAEAIAKQYDEMVLDNLGILKAQGLIKYTNTGIVWKEDVYRSYGLYGEMQNAGTGDIFAMTNNLPQLKIDVMEYAMLHTVIQILMHKTEVTQKIIVDNNEKL